MRCGSKAPWPKVDRVVSIPLANRVRVPVREVPGLIARAWLGANCAHALDFKVAKNAVVPVAAIRLRKQSKEQKHISHSYAVLAQMRLGGASLTEGTVAAFEHWVIMAESFPRQPSLR